MDQTPMYIKMSDRNKDIQRLWQLNRGDFYYCKRRLSGEAKIKMLLHPNTVYKSFRTWLPRQDQLQDIIFTDKYKDSINIQVSLFYKFCLEYPYLPGYLATAIFNSKEQLWMAFVSKEKFNRKWTGEEWKTIS